MEKVSSLVEHASHQWAWAGNVLVLFHFCCLVVLLLLVLKCMWILHSVVSNVFCWHGILPEITRPRTRPVVFFTSTDVAPVLFVIVSFWKNKSRLSTAARIKTQYPVTRTCWYFIGIRLWPGFRNFDGWALPLFFTFRLSFSTLWFHVFVQPPIPFSARPPPA